LKPWNVRDQLHSVDEIVVQFFFFFWSFSVGGFGKIGTYFSTPSGGQLPFYWVVSKQFLFSEYSSHPAKHMIN
jgi:hypothetical protein